MRTFVWLCWIITALAACVAVLDLFAAASADSAPKQGAGAAVACAMVIIPYVFTRAVEAMRSLGMEKPPTTPAG